MNKEKNIYMGCGPDIREGFIHCDIREFEHVDIVCKAWELSSNVKEVNHIYSRHMLEYLTNYEADRALRDWFKALKTDGTIRIIVPDMDFYCKQWLKAEWNEESLKDKWSDAKHSFAGIWGWQSECDPWSDDYNSSYLDVHKSGYNAKRLKLLLERIGFIEVETETKDNWHLVAVATKPKYSGERQIGTSLNEIRQDHLNRYIFASKYIKKQDSIVIDAACGVGYGSFVLAQNENIHTLYGLDVSMDALVHAQMYFNNNNKIKYQIKDLEENSFFDLPKSDYFISFETIEHLHNAERFIENVAMALKDNGLFIGSTPNEDIMPFVQQNFLYHTRHYRQHELMKILSKLGFSEIEFFQQKNDEKSEITDSTDGHFIIFIARKTSIC